MHTWKINAATGREKLLRRKKCLQIIIVVRAAKDEWKKFASLTCFIFHCVSMNEQALKCQKFRTFLLLGSLVMELLVGAWNLGDFQWSLFPFKIANFISLQNLVASPPLSPCLSSYDKKVWKHISPTRGTASIMNELFSSLLPMNFYEWENLYSNFSSF